MRLSNHLFPGDGNESVAIALCGRQKSNLQTRLLVHEIIPIPLEECETRTPNLIKWSTANIIPHLLKASRRGLAILKIHSHPNGYPKFSNIDDRSDHEFFESIFGWMDDNEPHCSAIMLPGGRIFGRIFNVDLTSNAISKVIVVGDDIVSWESENSNRNEEFELRTIQAFGAGTTNRLKKMKVGIVGCSGTGSPLIEQLVRLGIGELLLIDPDKIEKKNLNRIFNSTMKDAINGTYKVEVLKKAINNIGLGTIVNTHDQNIYASKAIINDIASCDIIFGCVDSVDGRHLLNQISTFYLIPYFDVGVKLTSNGEGGINQIMGTVHYMQPGGSSLRTRGVYSDEELRAASMFRTNREAYEEQKKSGYIVDINVDSPAVISINTQLASMAVNEMLARIHLFRYDSNKEFAINRISFTDSYYQYEKDGKPDLYLEKFVGRGDMSPVLNMPELD